MTTPHTDDKLERYNAQKGIIVLPYSVGMDRPSEAMCNATGTVCFVKDKILHILSEGYPFSNFVQIPFELTTLSHHAPFSSMAAKSSLPTSLKVKCNEQAFHLIKCAFCHQYLGDNDKIFEVFARILRATSPKYMLQASRELPGMRPRDNKDKDTVFWDDAWKRNINTQVLESLFHHKVDEKPVIVNMVRALMHMNDCDDFVLYECNKHDSFYGIGMSLFDAVHHFPDALPDSVQNVMGKIVHNVIVGDDSFISNRSRVASLITAAVHLSGRDAVRNAQLDF